MERDIRKTTENAADSPVAWFVVLERARQDRDYELAGRAIRELKRLGVTVRYRRNRKGQVHG